MSALYWPWNNDFTPYLVLGFGHVERGNPQMPLGRESRDQQLRHCWCKVESHNTQPPPQTHTHTLCLSLQRSGMALLVGSRVVFQTLRPQTSTTLDYFCRFQGVMHRAAAGSGGLACGAANGGLRQFSSDANDLSVKYLDGDDSGRRQLAIRSRSGVETLFLR